MKLKILLSLLLLGTLTSLTACYSTTFQYPDRQPTRVVDVSRPFWIAGLINGEKRPVVAYELCGGAVKSVETFNSFGQVCLGVITLQIYTPNTVRITCASGSAHNFYLNDEDMVVAHEVVDSGSGEVVYRSMYSDIL
ncbi:MAG: hypothetical protein H0U74_04405 [Bradymonadaceae bacterium]|nr:hypothetical protein [Lujinxingiaceae bacterium]